MNKPSKCKNCQWYGKPYWSVINPCDNCYREEKINIFIDTEDMEERYGEEIYKEYLEKENKRLNNIINSLEKWLKENNLYNTNDNILNKIKELKEKV